LAPAESISVTADVVTATLAALPRNRRRAGERGRPQDELDYIDRLLRRF